MVDLLPTSPIIALLHGPPMRALLRYSAAHNACSYHPALTSCNVTLRIANQTHRILLANTDWFTSEVCDAGRHWYTRTLRSTYHLTVSKLRLALDMGGGRARAHLEPGATRARLTIPSTSWAVGICMRSYAREASNCLPRIGPMVLLGSVIWRILLGRKLNGRHRCVYVMCCSGSDKSR